jgi:hypothetical protein
VLLGNSTAIPAPVPTTPAINMPLYCRLKTSQKPTAAESAITQTLHCQQEYSMAANNTTSQLVCCDNDETTQQVQDTINKMRISE